MHRTVVAALAGVALAGASLLPPTQALAAFDEPHPASLEAFEAMNLDVMPDELAVELRGEGFTFSWSSWAWNRLADGVVAGGVIICGVTAPCVFAASLYGAYRVLQDPIYEAAYVYYRY